MNTKKKVLVTTLSALFALNTFGFAFADELSNQSKNQTGQHFLKDRGTFRGANLEELAAEKGITVDELKAQFEQERQAKLEEMAAEKGISVDELKAQMGQKHGMFRGANLEELAAEKGITVDELKAQFEQERQAKLEEMAAEKGISVDELKAQMEQERPSKTK